METFGSEGKKIKKKDKDVFYYPNGKRETPKNLVRVPGMFDPEPQIKKFAEMCVKISLPDVTSSEFEEVWADALSKNTVVIDALETLKSESDSAGEIWKSRVYGKAVKSLKSLKIPIVSATQVMKVPGIGKGIAAHISEIVKTGRFKSQEDRLENSIKRQTTLENFLSIWGVTSRLANKWYDNGRRDIEDLVDEKLTHQQKVGIKYMEELKLSIPREDAKLIFDAIKRMTLKLYPLTKMEIVGSYRRGDETSENIDIIILNRGDVELQEIIKRASDGSGPSGLFPDAVITDVPILDDEKFMGIAVLPYVRSDDDNEDVDIQIHRRINIRLVPLEEWGTSLLFSTGPDTFNTQLKQQASQLGYKLDEKGLYKLSVQDDGDELIPTRTEKDIFIELGISYVEPEKRS
jgi:DNA polymerase/3'-5' exonuclease PolX